ncbi:MAG: hypothetical protein J6A01_12420 [Proteobacteria bacterium]|nr:hypothetical protein [Pseudomonadota bacterium]
MKNNPIVFIVLCTAILLFMSSVAFAAPNNSKPKAGDDCDTASFKSFCMGDYAMRCIKGKVKAHDCASMTRLDQQYTCAEFVISGKVSCINEADQCYVENDKIIREKTINGLKKTEFLRCEKAASGKLYYKKFSADRQPLEVIQRENIKQGDKCEKENEYVESEQVSENGNAKTMLFRCAKNSNGELIYKVTKISKPKNKDLNKPRDTTVDLPFDDSEKSKSSSNSKKKSSSSKKKKQGDLRPKDKQIDLPF